MTRQALSSSIEGGRLFETNAFIASEARRRDLLVSNYFEGRDLIRKDLVNSQVVLFSDLEQKQREKITDAAILTLKYLRTASQEGTSPTEAEAMSLGIQIPTSVRSTVQLVALSREESCTRSKVIDTAQEILGLLQSTFVKIMPQKISVTTQSAFSRELDALKGYEQSTREGMSQEYERLLQTLQATFAATEPSIAELGSARRKSAALQSQLIQLEAASRKNISLKESATIVEEAVGREFIELQEANDFQSLRSSHLSSLLMSSRVHHRNLSEASISAIVSTESQSRQNLCNHYQSGMVSIYGFAQRVLRHLNQEISQIVDVEQSVRLLITDQYNTQTNFAVNWFSQQLANHESDVLELCDSENTDREQLVGLRNEGFHQMVSVFEASIDNNNLQTAMMAENESLLRHEITSAWMSTTSTLQTMISSHITTMAASTEILLSLETTTRSEMQALFLSSLSSLRSAFTQQLAATAFVINTTIVPTEGGCRTSINCIEADQRFMLELFNKHECIKIDNNTIAISELVNCEQLQRNFVEKESFEEVYLIVNMMKNITALVETESVSRTGIVSSFENFFVSAKGSFIDSITALKQYDDNLFLLNYNTVVEQETQSRNTLLNKFLLGTSNLFHNYRSEGNHASLTTSLIETEQRCRSDVSAAYFQLVRELHSNFLANVKTITIEIAGVEDQESQRRSQMVLRWELSQQKLQSRITTFMDAIISQQDLIVRHEEGERICIKKLATHGGLEINSHRMAQLTHIADSVGNLEALEQRCRKMILSQYRDANSQIYHNLALSDHHLQSVTSQLADSERYSRRALVLLSESSIGSLSSQFHSQMATLTNTLTMLATVEKATRKKLSNTLQSEYQGLLIQFKLCAEGLIQYIDHETDNRNRITESEQSVWQSLRQYHERTLTDLLDGVSVINATEMKSRTAIEKKQHLNFSLVTQQYMSQISLMQQEEHSRLCLHSMLLESSSRVWFHANNSLQLVIKGTNVVIEEESLQRTDILLSRNSQMAEYKNIFADVITNHSNVADLVVTGESYSRKLLQQAECEGFLVVCEFSKNQLFRHNAAVSDLVLDESVGRKSILDQFASSAAQLTASITKLVGDEKDTRLLIEEQQSDTMILLQEMAISSSFMLTELAEEEVRCRQQIEDDHQFVWDTQTSVAHRQLSTSTLYEHRANSFVEIQFAVHDEYHARRVIADERFNEYQQLAFQSALIVQGMMFIESTVAEEIQSRISIMTQASSAAIDVICSSEMHSRQCLSSLFKLNKAETRKRELIASSQSLSWQISRVGSAQRVVKLFRNRLMAQQEAESNTLKNLFLLGLYEMDHRNDIKEQYNNEVCYFNDMVSILSNQALARSCILQEYHLSSEMIERDFVCESSTKSHSLLRQLHQVVVDENTVRSNMREGFRYKLHSLWSGFIASTESLRRQSLLADEQSLCLHQAQCHQFQLEELYQRSVIIKDNEPHSWSSLKTLANLDKSYSAVELTFEEESEARLRLQIDQECNTSLLLFHNIHSLVLSESSSRSSIIASWNHVYQDIRELHHIQQEFTASVLELSDSQNRSFCDIFDGNMCAIRSGVVSLEHRDRGLLQLLMSEYVDRIHLFKKESREIQSIWLDSMQAEAIIQSQQELIKSVAHINLLQCETDEVAQRNTITTTGLQEHLLLHSHATSVINDFCSLEQTVYQKNRILLDQEQSIHHNEIDSDRTSEIVTFISTKSLVQVECYQRSLIENNASHELAILNQMSDVQVNENRNRSDMITDMMQTLIERQHLNEAIYDSRAKDQIEINWEKDQEDLSRQKLLLSEANHRSHLRDSYIFDKCSILIISLQQTETTERLELQDLESTYRGSLLRSHYAAIISADVYDLTSRLIERTQQDVDTCIDDESTSRSKIEIEEREARSFILQTRLQFDLSKSQLMYQSCKAALDSHKRRIDEYKIATAKLQHLISAEKIQYANVTCLGIGKPAGRLEVLSSNKSLEDFTFMKDPFSVLCEKEKAEREVQIGHWNNGIKAMHTLMVLDSMQNGALREEMSPKRRSRSRSPGSRWTHRSPSRRGGSRGSSPAPSRSGRSVSPAKFKTSPIPPRPAWVHAPGRASPPPSRPLTPRSVSSSILQ
eukprot:TRINITY_DN52_c0_g1_i2.p1 TRINITY_DN52_c0_g1~~TRINITY_DN52_c0_g1_i2.p1  ORF type:complete len:2254 (+),score=414.72 TRINITY_DN52_c0_g1_i2:434-6763(+)